MWLYFPRAYPLYQGIFVWGEGDGHKNIIAVFQPDLYSIYLELINCMIDMLTCILGISNNYRFWESNFTQIEIMDTVRTAENDASQSRRGGKEHACAPVKMRVVKRVL